MAADYSSQAHESATAVDYLVTLLLKLRIAHRIQKVVDIPESGFLKTIVSVFLRDTWSAGSRERAAEVAGRLGMPWALQEIVPEFPTA